MVSKKNKKKMFNGKNMIGIKIWRQRSETGNLFYHMVTTGAIFFFFFLITALLKAKECMWEQDSGGQF